jgi:hypothetical protein
MRKNYFLFLLFVVSSVLGQNAIVGPGFSSGWNGASCSNNTNFQFMSASLGTSYIRILTANGTGNQYFRAGIDWTGAQYSISGAGSAGQNNPISTNTTYTLNSLCDYTGTMYLNVPNVSYNYVFKTRSAGNPPAAPSQLAVFEVQGAVRSIVSTSRTAELANQNVTVTANLNGALSTGQEVYLRYATNSLLSSSTVVKMTGSATTYTAAIPSNVNTEGATLYYYMFTSGNSGVATDGSNADFYTINYLNNSSSNYSYTVSSNPVSVVSTGGTTFATYANLGPAITAINNGIHSGTVTCYLNAGWIFTAPGGGYVLPTVGTASNPITFIKNGTGTVTVQASSGQTVGSINDAVFKIIGGDYITLDGLTIQENASNTISASAATNNMTEFGVGLFYSSLTNGSQNNIIQNCTISLNKTYLNTFGIYSNTRHSATDMLTTAEVTAASGANSNNKIYSNTISNVNCGIALIGAGTTSASIDSGNDIGGSSLTTGNTISNWGGGSALSSYISLTSSNYCIFSNQQINDIISFNTITSASISSGVTTGGILKNYSVASPIFGTIATTINNNTISVSNNPTSSTSGDVFGINNLGLTPVLNTATVYINNNTVQNCVLGGSTSTTNGISCISNSSAPGTLNITGNNIVNNSISATSTTSGLLVGLSNSGDVKTVNITGNTIRSMSSTAASGQMQGIINSGVVATAININNNFLGNASSGFFSSSVASSGALYGITSTGGANTCALSIQNNDIRGINYAVGATSNIYLTRNTATTLSQNFSNNTYTNLSINSTGNVRFIDNDVALPNGGFVTASSNSIVTGFSKTGAGGNIFLYYTTALPSSLSGTTKTAQNNNFSNITLTGNTQMDGWVDIEGFSSGGASKNISNNTFSNWTCGSGTINVIQNQYCGGTTSISGNTISNISGTGAIIGIINPSTNSGTSLTVSNNTISGLSSSAAVTAIKNFSSATANIISSNIINTLSSTSTIDMVVGIYSGASASIYSNTINSLSCVGNTSGTTDGIIITAGTAYSIYKNKIYDLTTSGSSSANPCVTGLEFSSSTSSAIINAYNNVIGDLKAPTANTTDAVRGISITLAAATSNFNLYHNTVFLNAASSGTNFGTSGLFHRFNTTSTTSKLILRNNIIINNSTPNGSGLTVAFRRNNNNNLNNYDTTSNNNIFYAGTPGTSKLVYYDGTNSDQTLASFQTRVTPRETLSQTENTTFQSTTGSNANYLRIALGTLSYAESGAVLITSPSINTDFWGITRPFPSPVNGGNAPDIGASEFDGSSSFPACATPTSQATAFLIGSTTATSLAGSFSAALGLPTGYLVVRSLGTLNTNPTNGTIYSGGNTLGNGTVIQSSSALSFSESSLTSNTAYTITIFTYNSGVCSGGPKYFTSSPLIGIITTCPDAPTAATSSATSDTGFTASWTASNGGGGAATINYFVEVYADSGYTTAVAGSPFSAGTATTKIITGLNSSTIYYYRIRANNGSCDSAYLIGGSVTTTCVTPTITVTNGSRCGAGTVTLAANPSAGTVSWFAASTGGTALATGTPFTTPSISTTTTYYAQAQNGIGGMEIGGKLSSTGADGNTIFTATGLTFDAYSSTILYSTLIYPVGTGTVTIALYNSSGTELSSTAAISVTGTGVSTPVTIPLNFIIPAGTGYKLLLKNYTGITGLIRDFVQPFPYISTNISVTGNLLENVPNGSAYYFFYALNLSSICASPRIPVTATVSNNVATSITPSPSSATICSGTIQTLTASGGAVSGQPILTDGFNAFTTQFVYDSTSGTYSATLSNYYAEGVSSILLNTTSTSANGFLRTANNIDLTPYTSAVLTFKHICATEAGYDFGYVEYSTNGGSSWITFPTNSYTGAATLKNGVVSFDKSSYTDWNSQFTYSGSTPGTAPASSLWKTETIAIPAAALTSTQFQIRFKYTNDSSLNYYGWLLDDFVLSGSGSSPQTTWSPTTGLYTDTLATTPYTGSVTSTVYAQPNVTTTYTITAGCSSTSTVTVNVPTATWSGSWSTPPTATTSLVFNSDYTSSGNLSGCSCTVNSGAVSIASGHTLSLLNNVTVNGGSLTFENNASLLQTNSAIANTGNITYKRNTSILQHDNDYVYWGAPVNNPTLGSIWMANGSDTFYNFDTTVNNWASQSSSSIMTPGVGYIARAQNGQNGFTTGASWLGQFVGVPNNGTIPITVVKSGLNFNNLIANPYPSALDLETFYEDNNTKITANFFFWTHNTAITNNVYTASDYATYNAVLGVGVGTSAAAITGGNAPDRNVDAGQGFFAEGNNSGGTVNFKNTQRVAGSNSGFYKIKPKNSISSTLESHKFWLNVSNSDGLFKQQLLTYTQGATNEFDTNLDAGTFDGNDYIDFYSIIPDNHLVIQSRALPFNDQDIVPLGFKTALAGNYEISIDHFDGLFQNQVVYLRDNLLNTIHDLKQNSYSFTTDLGIFNDRFELIYSNISLSNSSLNFNNDIILFNKNQVLHILSNIETIHSVQLFDIRGRKLYEIEKTASKHIEIKELKPSQQVLLVYITDEKDRLIIKKIIF